MSERSEGYRKTSVKPCGYTSWPQTREMLSHRAHWLVLTQPRPHQNDARIAMQPGRAYEAAHVALRVDGGMTASGNRSDQNLSDLDHRRDQYFHSRGLEAERLDPGYFVRR